jgi:flagellar assembly protein FliH
MSSRIIRATSVESQNIISFEFGRKSIVEHQQSIHPPSSAASATVNDIAVPREDTDDAPKLRTAEQQAELLVRQAKMEASEIEKQAYERGFIEGEKAGKEVGEKTLDALLRQYAKRLEELNDLRKDIFATSEREVLRLALEIARKVIRREVSVDEELILTLVKVALSRLAEQTVMTVRVNPKDYQSIQRHQAAYSPTKGLNEGVKLIEDPSISRGGCLIETESGIIDGRIDEQLREIEKGFLEE